METIYCTYCFRPVDGSFVSRWYDGRSQDREITLFEKFPVVFYALVTEGADYISYKWRTNFRVVAFFDKNMNIIVQQRENETK